MSNDKLIIDTGTVKRLIISQFPQWKDISVRPVAGSGLDI